MRAAILAFALMALLATANAKVFGLCIYSNPAPPIVPAIETCLLPNRLADPNSVSTCPCLN